MDIKESGRLNLDTILANGFDPPRWSIKTLRKQAEEIADALALNGLLVTEQGQADAHARWTKAADVIEAGLRERDTIVQKLILVYTEVTEGETSVLAPSPDNDPLAEELADIAIRVTGVLWGIWGSDWSVRSPDPHVSVNPFQPIEVVLRPIRDYLTRAVEAWRKDQRVDCKVSLELALKETMVAARACSIDLVGEMERKRAKNATRPECHGNKRSDG